MESRVFVTTRSPDVVRTLHKAAATWGYPKRFLTDIQAESRPEGPPVVRATA